MSKAGWLILSGVLCVLLFTLGLNMGFEVGTAIADKENPVREVS